MTITIDDKCYKCDKSLLSNMLISKVREVLHKCPYCGIYICKHCFEKMEEEQRTVCPNCGNNKNK